MAFEKRRTLPLNPFSPWRSPPGSLQRIIVGRDHVLKDILEKTARFCGGAPAKHCLITGRRGLGKTHLLSLLYHFFDNRCAHEDFEDISTCILPALLLEEERFSLNSLTVFLIKVFDRFHENRPREERWRIPAELETDEDVIDYCFETLKEISKSGERKILILCDNLEEVFKQWQDKEFKKLRSFLSDQQAVMIIGTAVRVFREIVSPKQPFYEFFETVPLVDLTQEQMLEMLRKRFIEDHMEKEFEQKEKHLKNKIAAISKLTGGNPRLVVFLYDIVTKKNVFEIEDAIDELMEGLGEYFRNRFSDLAPQERTILDAFAGMEGPATPKEIVQKARLKGQSVYTHIKRLKDAGFIEPVEYGRHKITRYDVTERLFRIWRQTATVSGKKKFSIFVKFLQIYFTPEELKVDFLRSAQHLDSAFLRNERKDAEELNRYLYYLQHAARGELKFDIFDKRTDYLLKAGDYSEAEEEILEFKKELETGQNEHDVKTVYKKLMQVHLEQEKYPEVCNDILKISIFPITDDKGEYLAILDRILKNSPYNDGFLFTKGAFLMNTGDAEEALQYFDKAIKLNPRIPIYYHGKAFALQKSNHMEEALPVIEKAIELDNKEFKYWIIKGMLLIATRKHKDALKNFKKANELAPEEHSSYFSYAVALNYLKRYEEALPLIVKAIELDKKNALYWCEKAEILSKLGRYEEAGEYYRKFMELNPEEINHKLEFIKFLINKACLGDFGEHMEGLAGKIELENLEESQFESVAQFVGQIIEACLQRNDTRRAEGLFLTLLKLPQWHHVDEVQQKITLYMIKLAERRDKDAFIKAVNAAQEHIRDEDLLELLKAFLYASRYLQEGNKVIFEEVFPEVRDIIFDILNKFGEH